jgi:hypothetical protein
MLEDFFRYLVTGLFEGVVLTVGRAVWALLVGIGRGISWLIIEAIAFIVGPGWRAVRLVLQTIAALALLFAEWGWKPLHALLDTVARAFNWTRLRLWVVNLPPYGALALFAAPAVCLFPLKLLALFLFATGHAVLGVGLIAFAKIVGTAVVARIFMLTQPKLMQIAWFAAAYNRFIPWKDAMFASIRQSAAWRYGRAGRVAAKRWVHRVWLRLAPQRTWASRQVALVRKRLVALIRGTIGSSL